MFASMSTFRAEGLDMAETAQIVGETMEPWMGAYDGYEGLLILTDQASGMARMITFWASPEAAERSRSGRLTMRDRLSETIGVDVEGTEPYHVSFRHRL
jgi:hypothetical protein